MLWTCGGGAFCTALPLLHKLDLKKKSTKSSNSMNEIGHYFEDGNFNTQLGKTFSTSATICGNQIWLNYIIKGANVICERDISTFTVHQSSREC